MMFQNDYILREIENLSRFLARAIFHKEAALELIDEQGYITEGGALYQRLRALLAENKICEAEDLLFDEFEQLPQRQRMEAALQFYQDVQSLSGEQLRNANFSRQEIPDGLEAIQRMYERGLPEAE
jgi:archaellum biogenesis ATPase FlaH